MAVKGYTKEEVQLRQHKKRIRLFYIVAVLQFFMVFANIIAAFIGLGVVAAFVTLVMFFALWGIFASGIIKLSEEGHRVKKFNIIKFVCLILYICSFAIAIFS